MKSTKKTISITIFLILLVSLFYNIAEITSASKVDIDNQLTKSIVLYATFYLVCKTIIVSAITYMIGKSIWWNEDTIDLDIWRSLGYNELTYHDQEVKIYKGNKYIKKTHVYKYMEQKDNAHQSVVDSMNNISDELHKWGEVSNSNINLHKYDDILSKDPQEYNKEVNTTPLVFDIEKTISNEDFDKVDDKFEMYPGNEYSKDASDIIDVGMAEIQNNKSQPYEVKGLRNATIDENGIVRDRNGRIKRLVVRDKNGKVVKDGSSNTDNNTVSVRKETSGENIVSIPRIYGIEPKLINQYSHAELADMGYRLIPPTETDVYMDDTRYSRIYSDGTLYIKERYGLDENDGSRV